MGLKEYCLLCEDEIIKQDNPSTSSVNGSGDPVTPPTKLPKLETICHCLKIKLPTKGKTSGSGESPGEDGVNYNRLFENLRHYFNGEKKILKRIDDGRKSSQHLPKLCVVCLRKLSVLDKLLELLKETEERVAKRRKQMLNLILSSGGKHDKEKKTQPHISSKVCSSLLKKTELESKELVQMIKYFVKKGTQEEEKVAPALIDPPPPAQERTIIKVVVYQPEEVIVPRHKKSVINESMNEDEENDHFSHQDMDSFVDENDDDDDRESPEYDNLYSKKADNTGSARDTQRVCSRPLIINKPNRKADTNVKLSIKESSSYTCRYCQETCSTPLEYYNHRKTLHSSNFESLSNVSLIPNSSNRTQEGDKGNSIGSWQCNVCDVKFPFKNMFGIMDHMGYHETEDSSDFYPKGETASSSVNPYQCNICGQKYKWKVNLDLHKICFHESTGLVRLTCDQCGDTKFDTRENLIRHLKEDHPTKKAYSCKNCPVSCSALRKLMDHLKNSHADSVRLLCPNPKCTMAFISFVDLNQHCREKHIVTKSKLSASLKYPCGRCNRSFISNAGYEAHLKRCSNKGKPAKEPPIVCPLCPGKTYKSLTTLKLHKKRMHSSESDKKSAECEKDKVHMTT